MQTKDPHTRYGKASRALHWAMAALLGWQFSGMLSKITLGKDHAVTELLSGNHSQIGSLLFVLICIRLLWSIKTLRERPRHDEGFAGTTARIGHIALYALMLIIPSAALIRAWGGERAFAPFGFEIFSARAKEEVNVGAVDFGGNFHGELGWVLFAMILGHIGMALYHHYVKKDGLLNRM